jgi:hypothetical protein
MQRVADVAHEDGQARAPLSGLFDDLDEPDPTLAVALARVLSGQMVHEGRGAGKQARAVSYRQHALPGRRRA